MYRLIVKRLFILFTLLAFLPAQGYTDKEKIEMGIRTMKFMSGDYDVSIEAKSVDCITDIRGNVNEYFSTIYNDCISKMDGEYFVTDFGNVQSGFGGIAQFSEPQASKSGVIDIRVTDSNVFPFIELPNLSEYGEYIDERSGIIFQGNSFQPNISVSLLQHNDPQDPGRWRGLSPDFYNRKEAPGLYSAWLAELFDSPSPIDIKNIKFRFYKIYHPDFIVLKIKPVNEEEDYHYACDRNFLADRKGECTPLREKEATPIKGRKDGHRWFLHERWYQSFKIVEKEVKKRRKTNKVQIKEYFKLKDFEGLEYYEIKMVMPANFESIEFIVNNNKLTHTPTKYGDQYNSEHLSSEDKKEISKMSEPTEHLLEYGYMKDGKRHGPVWFNGFVFDDIYGKHYTFSKGAFTFENGKLNGPFILNLLAGQLETHTISPYEYWDEYRAGSDIQRSGREFTPWYYTGSKGFYVSSPGNIQRSRIVHGMEKLRFKRDFYAYDMFLMRRGFFEKDELVKTYKESLLDNKNRFGIATEIYDYSARDGDNVITSVREASDDGLPSKTYHFQEGRYTHYFSPYWVWLQLDL